MNGKWILVILGSLALPFIVIAQDTTEVRTAFQLDVYAELYYIHDFNRPATHERPFFVYSHNRVDEVNLNLGLLRASYLKEKIRANLGIATGTYMNANYASEEGVLKNMYEANIGFSISKNNLLWFDAGIMPSHIGFESAIGKDNKTLTRSLVAENSPYFETGAKLGYTTQNGKWYVAGLFLNGWQNIERADGNKSHGLGLQISYKPNDQVLLNYSNYFGNEFPKTSKRFRNFHNLYGVFKYGNYWELTAGFDYGLQQKDFGSDTYVHWWAPVFIASFHPNERWNMAARAEYYQDAFQANVLTSTPNGFNIWGLSANIDYQIAKEVLWRAELRTFYSKDGIFIKESTGNTRENYSLSTSLSIAF